MLTLMSYIDHTEKADSHSPFMHVSSCSSSGPMKRIVNMDDTWCDRRADCNSACVMFRYDMVRWHLVNRLRKLEP